MSRPAAPSRRPPVAAGVAVAPDRRFHRSALRPERRRVGRTLMRAAKWAACVSLVAGLGAWIANVVLHAGVLAVQHVRVRGNVRLTAPEVRALVDGVQGQNIFQVDFDDYRRRVLDSPWVASVALSRVLPSTIDVRIVERTPMAVARVGQQLFLVDDTGVIIDAHSAEYSDLDLPVVDGLVSSPGDEGPLVDGGRVAVTAAFLAALASRPDLARRVSQIDVRNAHDVVVMFDHAAVWLHLGDQRFIDRLNTYLELAPMLQERFADLDYVDLRFGERIFVRPRGRTGRVAVR